MKEIQLTQGKIALVSDEDYENVNEYKWCASKAGKTFYAVRGDNKSTQAMHRFIFGLKNGEKKDVDHIDMNGLNNQRENIRVCSRSENKRNVPPLKNKTSKYKGVFKGKSHSNWQCQITINGVLMHLGSFKDEVEAAKAYNKKAKDFHGEFAQLNSL